MGRHEQALHKGCQYQMPEGYVAGDEQHTHGDGRRAAAEVHHGQYFALVEPVYDCSPEGSEPHQANTLQTCH